MTTLQLIKWFFFVVLTFIALTSLQYPIRKRVSLTARIILVLIKFALACAIAAIVMATNTWMAWRGSFFFGALYVALMGDTIASILICLYLIVRSALHQNPSVKNQLLISAICTLLFFLYGTINMQIVRARPIGVESEKLINTYRVVFVADLHVGSSQSLETSKEIIRKIQNENADFVILGGDITDEYTTKEEMEEIYNMFGGFDTPTYFVYGNHDRQPNAHLANGPTYTEEELAHALEKNGIIVLDDKWIPIAEDFILMGRDDISTGVDRIPIEEIPPRPEGKYVLLVDHSPYIVDDTVKSRADLQLSGHTHAGQLFPLQYLYNITGFDAYGFYLHGYTDTFVSAGASGWSFPFRTEEHCEYNVITFSQPNDHAPKIENP